MTQSIPALNHMTFTFTVATIYLWCCDSGFNNYNKILQLYYDTDICYFLLQSVFQAYRVLHTCEERKVAYISVLLFRYLNYRCVLYLFVTDVPQRQRWASSDRCTKLTAIQTSTN